MSDSTDNTNELDSYGVWVKNTNQDEGTDDGLNFADSLDLPDFEANLAAFKRAVKVEVLPISCKTGEGLTELKDYLFQHFMSHTKTPPEEEKILDGVNRGEAL